MSLVRRLSLYAASLYTEAVYGLMALLGLVGFVLAVARVPQRKAALSIGFAYAFYIVVFNSLANLGLSPLLRGVTARFWQHPNLTVFFFAGVALGRLRNRFSASKWASVLLPSVLVCLLGMQTSYVWPTRDLSAAAEVELYGESILNFMPPNALVLLNGDLNNNAPKYLFGCERKRQDLRLIRYVLSCPALSCPHSCTLQSAANVLAVVCAGPGLSLRGRRVSRPCLSPISPARILHQAVPRRQHR